MSSSSGLSLDRVLPLLENALARAAKRIRSDPQAHDFGAVIGSQTGRAELGHTSTGPVLAASVVAWLHGGEAVHLQRASAAAQAILRLRRPSGRIDLIDCNIDSDPDTAFLLHLLCRCLDLIAERSEAAGLRADLLHICRDAADALLDGGVHTPNHRWVLAAALAGCAHHLDTAAYAEAAQSWMLETPDISAEGLFIERSVGGYDAVNDRSLLLIDEYLGWPAGRDAAIANLRANLALLNGDGSADTGLSKRWDQGQRKVPDALIAIYIQAWHLSGDDALGSTAAWLWENAKHISLSSLFWISSVLLRNGPLIPGPSTAPRSASVFWPQAGLWRRRDDDFSVSVYGNRTELLSLCWGANAISCLSIAQSYLGHGRFVGAEMQAATDSVSLCCAGHLPPYRLGYLGPLSEAIPPEKWDESIDRRSLRSLPDCASQLSLGYQAGESPTITLHWQSQEGLPEVSAQMALDLPVGGVWTCGDVILRPLAGQVLFLSGSGAYTLDTYRIHIGPGSAAHRTWQMRDTEAVRPDCFRLIIPTLTPVDHHIHIRCDRDIE